MQSLRLLQQTRPELFLDLLLPEHQVDAARGVVGLGVLDVDLAVQLHVDLVLYVLGRRRADEGYAGRFDVELGGGLVHVERGDGEVDDVLLGIAFVGALGPENCVRC